MKGWKGVEGHFGHPDHAHRLLGMHSHHPSHKGGSWADRPGVQLSAPHDCSRSQTSSGSKLKSAQGNCTQELCQDLGRYGCSLQMRSPREHLHLLRPQDNKETNWSGSSPACSLNQCQMRLFLRDSHQHPPLPMQPPPEAQGQGPTILRCRTPNQTQDLWVDTRPLLKSDFHVLSRCCR